MKQLSAALSVHVSASAANAGEIIAAHLMSSSFSGKLQYAMRSCSCSGTGGYTFSTTSNGMWNATCFADSSTSGIT